ncbi:MAG TPA: SRPBCC family protein [Pseudonocardiaceae bacterium]|nr:SRPBCC family protein [Pseudonocardiaceae bacterium]
MHKTQITAEPGVPLIVTSREFDAPRELVFRAFTEPELLVQWRGLREHTLTVERYETRDGGRWRYIATDADGTDYGFHGVFHGTPTPDALTQTFEFEGAPGNVSLQSAYLTERDGKTLVRTVSAFQSVVDRDAIVEGGMARGIHESDERLDELLGTLRTEA